MIYLKNNTETQAIYIPRQTVLGGGYIPSTKAYDKGYNDGLEVGKEQQKGKLSNLNVTANGQYEREDGWNVVTVDVPDLNGSYNEGYEQGKTDGANEQKSKLESISITENGTYNKEDGYNHIEVNVPSYEEGQADMAAKARVLNVTENGTYLSKFSDPIPPTLVTGVYADGTEFYNYAQLTNKVFNTNIPATPTTRLELWYKGDNTLAGDAWNIIIGAEKNPDYSCYQIRYFMYSNSNLRFELGRNLLECTWDENAWHHILIAKETENASSMSVWVDEVKIGDFGNIPFNPQSPFYINCIESDTSLLRNANGYFGMIKIDDTIIIPTANGFLNTNTGELLEVVKDGGYTYTENLPTYGEGELYKTINVNVPDLNGSYDEGKTDGINEQKSKLETINITENGTYNREDGYNKIIVKVPDLNGSYDEGYEQGQADIATNAKVLNVTENGVYKSKFSDPIMPTLVTGVYADGTDFYNYAQLGNKVYNTNITVTQDSVIELWYKGDNKKTDDGWDTIFGCTKRGDEDFWMGYMSTNNTTLNACLGQKRLQFSWDDNVWHHIIMKNDGLRIDDVLIGSFNTTKTFAYKLGLNSDGGSSIRHANGYFGMIKIDNTIIIPTADGFKNVNTGELLEVVQDGDYTFTKNLPTYGEGEIYKTINVNVPTEAVSCNLINPIVFSKEAGNTINAENVQIPTFVYEGNQYYNVSSFNLADIEEFKIHILFKPNNSGDSEPVNIFGCEDTDWGNTTFGARIYQGQIYFRMSGQDVEYPYTENAWYDVEMGYNTTKRWVIVNGETLLDAEYASFNKPSQTLMIGAINSGGNALRPFYGKIATIYIESNGNQIYLLPKEDGTMGVYWNDRINRRNTISGDNNARFENDYISGDGMKSITWLGNLEDKWVIPSMNDRDSNGFIVVRPSEGYNGLYRTVINPQTIYNEGVEAGSQAQDTKWVTPSTNDVDNNGYIVIRPDDGYVAMKRVAINVSTIKNEWTTIGKNSITDYDITAFTYKVYDWTSVNINRDNMTNDCGDRPLDCLLFRNRSGECTVMTKLDTCSGTARLENGWSGDSIILSLKSNSITKFSSNSINSNQLTSIDTGFAKLEGNAITNCNALTDIKVTVLNDNLSTQFATNCFNGLPAEGTITIGKNVDVTITDDEITSFFRTIVGEGWTITIKQ